MTFNQVSLLPLDVLTSWFAFFTCGVARDASFNTADKQGILIWESEAVWAVLSCRSPSRWDLCLCYRQQKAPGLSWRRASSSPAPRSRWSRAVSPASRPASTSGQRGSAGSSTWWSSPSAEPVPRTIGPPVSRGSGAGCLMRVRVCALACVSLAALAWTWTRLKRARLATTPATIAIRGPHWPLRGVGDCSLRWSAARDGGG